MWARRWRPRWFLLATTVNLTLSGYTAVTLSEISSNTRASSNSYVGQGFLRVSRLEWALTSLWARTREVTTSRPVQSRCKTIDLNVLCATSSDRGNFPINKSWVRVISPHLFSTNFLTLINFQDHQLRPRSDLHLGVHQYTVAHLTISSKCCKASSLAILASCGC